MNVHLVDGTYELFRHYFVVPSAKDADGAEFTDSRYAKFSKSASCEYVYMPQESGAASPRFILITVSVHYNGNEMVRAKRLVSR